MPERLLEELPVALARLEPDGRLTVANRAARQLLGAAAQPGVNLGALLEGLGLPIPERLADTMKGRALGRSEVARGLVDGQEVFLQIAFTRSVLDGRPAILAVLSDATELKTLEAQFVQSQKMQAVGQLAGGVAHDFNNLLTAINGHCDLLLMRHDVADVEHGDLMQIRQNANRAAALVRQLLAFSRKQTLRPTVINLQDTLGELTHLLNRLLTDKVTLRIEQRADLWPVRADERQIEQVIMNLVVNARDAMPRGGEVRITTRNVRLEQDSPRDRAVILTGDYVVIEVANSGHGIPEGKLNKIFEPFFTTKQVGEGTGLGLSTAYGIVKQTGGFIFADSPAGQGAIFTIYLPAYDKAEAPVPPAAPEAKRPRDLTGRGLVLLVEDEDPVRSFAARALRLRGYTVVEAASGEEALEILKDRSLHVDIMLSDVIMPGLDGPAWVREAQKARPEAKVIFMSGYAEDAFVGGDGGVPGAGFLPKPFTLNELTEKVKDQPRGVISADFTREIAGKYLIYDGLIFTNFRGLRGDLAWRGRSPTGAGIARERWKQRCRAATAVARACFGRRRSVVGSAVLSSAPPGGGTTDDEHHRLRRDRRPRGDPARASMLLALMDGRALTVGELASVAGVTPQTASGHLARLVGAGLLAVETQGRHRYHRLASPLVARMVETILSLGCPAGRTPGRFGSVRAMRAFGSRGSATTISRGGWRSRSPSGWSRRAGSSSAATAAS